MDFLYSVNMLKDGSVVMCGSTSGSLANTKSVSGHSDFVAVKLDAKGNHKWNWQVRARRLDPLDQSKSTVEHVCSFVIREGWVANTLTKRIDTSGGSRVLCFREGIAFESARFQR